MGPENNHLELDESSGECEIQSDNHSHHHHQNIVDGQLNEDYSPQLPYSNGIAIRFQDDCNFLLNGTFEVSQYCSLFRHIDCVKAQSYDAFTLMNEYR